MSGAEQSTIRIPKKAYVRQMRSHHGSEADSGSAGDCQPSTPDTSSVKSPASLSDLDLSEGFVGENEFPGSVKNLSSPWTPPSWGSILSPGTPGSSLQSPGLALQSPCPPTLRNDDVFVAPSRDSRGNAGRSRTPGSLQRLPTTSSDTDSGIGDSPLTNQRLNSSQILRQHSDDLLSTVDTTVITPQPISTVDTTIIIPRPISTVDTNVLMPQPVTNADVCDSQSAVSSSTSVRHQTDKKTRRVRSDHVTLCDSSRGKPVGRTMSEPPGSCDSSQRNLVLEDVSGGQEGRRLEEMLDLGDSRPVDQIQVKQEVMDNSYGANVQVAEVGGTAADTSHCQVCGDIAAGFHCGAFVCEACKKFFVRCVKSDHIKFSCPRSQSCVISRETRTQCQACRYQKCIVLGMYKPGGTNISSQISHIPCSVCGAPSSGYHFGAITCEGCKGFFRRTVKERDTAKYQCSRGNNCTITSTTRNICKFCRYRKCLDVGMKPDGSRIGRQPNAVKHVTMLQLQEIKMAKGLPVDFEVKPQPLLIKGRVKEDPTEQTLVSPPITEYIDSSLTKSADNETLLQYQSASNLEHQSPRNVEQNSQRKHQTSRNLEHQLSRNLEHQTTRNLEHQLSRNLEHQLSRNLEHQTTRNLEQQTSRNMEHHTSRNIEHQTSRNMEHQISRDMEHQKSRNMEHQTSRNMEHQISRNMECQTSRNMEHQISRNMEHQTSRNIEHQVSRNMEHQTSRNMEHQISRNIEHQISRNMEHQTSRNIEHQISRNMEHQTSRNIEHQISRNMEHQTSRNMEHQISRNMEHQTSRNIEHQKSRNMEHQTSRNMEHQSSRNMEHQISRNMEHQTSRNMEHQTLRNMEHQTSRNMEHHTLKNMENERPRIIEHETSQSSLEEQTSANQRMFERQTSRDLERETPSDLEYRAFGNLETQRSTDYSSGLECRGQLFSGHYMDDRKGRKDQGISPLCRRFDVESSKAFPPINIEPTISSIPTPRHQVSRAIHSPANTTNRQSTSPLSKVSNPLATVSHTQPAHTRSDHSPRSGASRRSDVSAHSQYSHPSHDIERSAPTSHIMSHSSLQRPSHNAVSKNTHNAPLSYHANAHLAAKNLEDNWSAFNVRTSQQSQSDLTMSHDSHDYKPQSYDQTHQSHDRRPASRDLSIQSQNETVSSPGQETHKQSFSDDRDHYRSLNEDRNHNRSLNEDRKHNRSFSVDHRNIDPEEQQKGVACEVECPENPPLESKNVIEVIQKAYKELGGVLHRCPDIPAHIVMGISLAEAWDIQMKQFSQCAHATLKFAKKVPGFRKLPIQEQISRIQESMYPMVVMLLSKDYQLSRRQYNYFNMNREEEEVVLSLFPDFRPLVQCFHILGYSVQSLRLDDTEIAFLCAFKLMAAVKEQYYEDVLIEALTYYYTERDHCWTRLGDVLLRLTEMARVNQIHMKSVVKMSSMLVEEGLQIPQLFQESFLND